jgi:hypothetical protein
VQSFSSPSPTGLMMTFYCLRFETHPTWRTRLTALSSRVLCYDRLCQSANVSWNKAPIWGLGPDFYYCQPVVSLFMWGALSVERTGLSFTIAAGPRQHSHSRVRVPWDSRPYFTVSDLRFYFCSLLFDPASTRN